MTRTLRSQRGASPLSMMLGVALMMGLMAYSVKQMQGPEGGSLEAVDKAKEAACATQRAQLARDIVMFQVDYPDVKPTIELLERAGTEIPPCPEHGEYEIHGRKVLCTVHSYKDEFEAAEREESQTQPRRRLSRSELLGHS